MADDYASMFGYVAGEFAAPQQSQTEPSFMQDFRAAEDAWRAEQGLPPIDREQERQRHAAATPFDIADAIDRATANAARWHAEHATNEPTAPLVGQYTRATLSARAHNKSDARRNKAKRAPYATEGE